ncbi:hypothetical protein SAMN06265795_103220 [Noviherbaspirillum humi]|uniref:Uncharacterized protein n=1 Tax=Noviherbaspirillum humi TaxID=1688639 RepID=A0A239F7B1_9BURK|nr:hypothetical protein SAMN06265795_103220 [Noviherbaspirillum humi]
MADRFSVYRPGVGMACARIRMPAVADVPWGRSQPAENQNSSHSPFAEALLAADTGGLAG